MAALFAPARLPLTSTEASDYHSSLNLDEDHHLTSRDDSSPYQDSYHSYIRAFITGTSRKRRHSLNNGTVFCVNLPEGIALPRSGGNYQSLTEPHHRAGMAVVMEEDSCATADMPCSPPELSFSKGSKSSDSSLHSDDDLSDPNFPEKSPHFEELALEEEEEEDVERDSVDNNLPPNSRPTLKRPPPKSHSVSDLHSAAQQAILRKAQSPPLRPLANGAGRRYPNLRGAVHGVLQDQSLNLPNGRSFYRSTSSPNSPYTRSGPPRVISRSPSPGHPISPLGNISSPQLVESSTPKASLENPTVTPFGRRSSWQPGQRKSVKELEAEYNDADEEVPDEAILENVPISPLPGHPSFFRSTSISSAMSSGRSSGIRSGTPSPHRKPSYANLH